MKIHDPDRERVTVHGHATNETTEIYVVAVNKILYISDILLLALVPDVDAVGNMTWVTAADVELRHLGGVIVDTKGATTIFQVVDRGTFPDYLEISAGEKIVLTSNAGGYEIHGSFSGWLVDA